MQSCARLLGHSIHQMLIVFPLGLLSTSLVFDMIHLATGNGCWAETAFSLVAAGLIGGLCGGVRLDRLARHPRRHACQGGRNVARLGNLGVVGLFMVSWFLRWHAPMQVSVSAFILSLLGVGLALVTGWLGGERLVDRLGVGVDEGCALEFAQLALGAGGKRQCNSRGRKDAERATSAGTACGRLALGHAATAEADFVSSLAGGERQTASQCAFAAVRCDRPWCRDCAASAGHVEPHPPARWTRTRPCSNQAPMSEAVHWNADSLKLIDLPDAQLMARPRCGRNVMWPSSGASDL